MKNNLFKRTSDSRLTNSSCCSRSVMRQLRKQKRSEERAVRTMGKMDIREALMNLNDQPHNMTV